jgi:hypothetical protein
MLLRYFLNDFDLVQIDLIADCITFVFTSHMCCILTVQSLYFKISLACFLITLLLLLSSSSLLLPLLSSLPGL